MKFPVISVLFAHAANGNFYSKAPPSIYLPGEPGSVRRAKTASQITCGLRCLALSADCTQFEFDPDSKECVTSKHTQTAITYENLPQVAIGEHFLERSTAKKKHLMKSQTRTVFRRRPTDLPAGQDESDGDLVLEQK